MELDFKISQQLGMLGRFFKGKKNSSVGVDIGSNSIKIVQLEKEKNQLVLKNYALAKVDCELTSPGVGAHLINDTTGEVVKNIFNKLGIKEKEINLAIPSFASLVTVINLEVTSEKEAQEIIELEAPKFIPVPLEDVVFDWQIIDEKISLKVDENREKNREQKGNNEEGRRFSGKKKAVLVAIMKDISRHYEKIFGMNGYKINSLEIDSFSLVRSLIGNDTENYIILDIGGKVCNVILVYQGNLVMNKSVNVAGYKLTEAMAKAVGIDPERAEKMKVQQGLEAEITQLREQVFDPLLGVIVEEVEKSLEIFKKNHADPYIKGIILSGGSSRMIGLSDYFKQKLKMEVFMGNPWSKINYPKKLEKSLIKLGPSFAVAVGLAMLELKE